MKLLLMIYSGPTPQHIAALLDAHNAGGYTEVGNAHGAGSTGRMLGTRAWPGTSAVFLSAVPDDRVPDLRTALHDYRSRAAEGEHLHVMTLPVEDAF
jgi:hypothetical protein